MNYLKQAKECVVQRFEAHLSEIIAEICSKGVLTDQSEQWIDFVQLPKDFTSQKAVVLLEELSDYEDCSPVHDHNWKNVLAIMAARTFRKAVAVLAVELVSVINSNNELFELTEGFRREPYPDSQDQIRNKLENIFRNFKQVPWKSPYSEEIKNIAHRIGQFFLEKNAGNHIAAEAQIQKMEIQKLEFTSDGTLRIELNRPGFLIGFKGKQIKDLMDYLGLSIFIYENPFPISDLLYPRQVDELSEIYEEMEREKK